MASYSSELWQLGIAYIEIADNFNPEVGFLRRSGFRNVDVGVAYTFRPTHFWKLQQMRPHGSFNRFWNFEGQIGDVVDALRLRLGVLVRQANTGQFIVYNDTRGLHDTTPFGAGRSLILKYSRLFDLIDSLRLDFG
ncbi:MAG: hypothetical protein MK365_08175 [Vicinamibacterales bacterium]|nr:hypothetical protein [Vicinamibacterales bacterium]